MRGEIEIGVDAAYVDVDEDEVCLQDRPILRVVTINVEDLAVGAPVATEVEQNALVAMGGDLERLSKIVAGLRRVGIDRVAAGSDRVGRTAWAGGSWSLRSALAAGNGQQGCQCKYFCGLQGEILRRVQLIFNGFSLT